MSRKLDPKHASIYTTIPNWLYDLLAKEASKERRSIAGQLGYILQERYESKRPTK